jgi:prepilin signal peptidase PulO-like enzyme (type II secretory pathway)
MAEKQPQSLASHTRFDPLFHFFLVPVFALGLVLSLIHFFAHLAESDFRDNFHSALLILLAVALLLWLFKTRLYALRVQDRVIRLEEFTESQLCGLRFASDAELPALAERALNEKLSRKDIKKSVQNWRPDYWRV